MIRLLGTIVSCFLLTACVITDSPMFPASTVPEVSPVSAGYYIMRKRETAEGRSLLSAEETPIVVQKTAGKYIVLGESKLKDTTDNRVFGPVGKDAYVGQGKSGNSYYYAKIFANATDFMVYINVCNKMRPMTQRSLASLGYMSIRDRSCVFSDYLSLIDSLGNDEKIWASYETEFFHGQTDRGVLADSLNPKLLHAISKGCSVAPKIVMGPAFNDASSRDIEGKHLRLISKSTDGRQSLELAVLLEAVGNNPSGYAWLMPWSAYQNKLHGCSPHRLIKVHSVGPKSNGFTSASKGADKEAIRAECRAEAYSQKCGTLDEVIASYGNQNLRVLLQGIELLRFPDGTLMEGSGITILGKAGDTDTLVVLVTYLGRSARPGLTRVLDGRNI